MKPKTFSYVAILMVLTMFFTEPIHSQAQGPPAKDTAVVAPPPPAIIIPPSTKGDSVVLKGTDSTNKVVSTNDITAPSTITVLGVKLPSWVVTLLTILLSVLPTVQTVLKMIPNATPIGGLIGKILNVLTFFIKNNNSPPPAANT